MLLFEGKDLHLPELDGMALGLKGNVPFGHHLVAVLDERSGVRVLFVKLRPLVFYHDLAVNEMFDPTVAVDLDFRLDPLVAVIGFGTG